MSSRAMQFSAFLSLSQTSLIYQRSLLFPYKIHRSSSSPKHFSVFPQTIFLPSRSGFQSPTTIDLKQAHIDMAKLGKLTKLKSAIKRWPSFTKSSSRSSANVDSAARCEYDDKVCKELQKVYVGKSRRRYLLSSNIVCHPLFQELIDKSSGACCDGEVVVACEVVLFEHLLWMLESGASQLGSAEELAEFYFTC